MHSATCLGKSSHPAQLTRVLQPYSNIWHHIPPSHGKYQDNQPCLSVIHVTICLGFPLSECCNTRPASQNISGLLLSKFLNLNKHERQNSALSSVCTNPICDIIWSCLNQPEHRAWPRGFQLIYGVHLAALNQGEPGLSADFKQCKTQLQPQSWLLPVLIMQLCPKSIPFAWLLSFLILPGWSSRTLP